MSSLAHKNDNSHSKVPLLEIIDLTVTSISRSDLSDLEQTRSSSGCDPLQSTNPNYILENLNLTIYPGEIHVIMGPNGAGKSTLANVLAKHPDYNIVSGKIKFLGQLINDFTPDQCAKLGIFLSLQYPVAIPGVSNLQFLKTAVNAIRTARGQSTVDAVDFLDLVKQHLQDLAIPESLLHRAINMDFSGGEKKRNEILQMLLLEPKLAILDEIDSGLDLDALKLIITQINKSLTANNAILLITHYPRILDYIKPDFVHILSNKQIVVSGGQEVVVKLEQEGYSWIMHAQPTTT